MGFGDIVTDLGEGALGDLGGVLDALTDPFKSKGSPKRMAVDFPEGFKVTEVINNAKKDIKDGYGFLLLKDQLPFQPFTFGGEQKIVKDYYPGNSEPVMQVLGQRETDITIKGRLKAKHFKTDDLVKAPLALQQQIDSVRVRGHLLLIEMGAFKRWGFLEKTKFDLNQNARIDYELTFSIMGFNKPTNCKFVDDSAQIPFKENKKVLEAMAKFFDKEAGSPMPKSLIGEINSAIGEVAKAVAQVTNFVNTVVATAENALKTVNRAIGLIKHAQATISQYKRRIRAILLSPASLGTTFTDKHGGLGSNPGAIFGLTTNAPTTQTKSNVTTNTYKNAGLITSSLTSASQLASTLAALKKQFEALSKTLPLARALVKDGDTLQKLSMKYYHSPDQWKLIYDHNKLKTTILVSGKLLEIPKL